jgi:hypothetical protein
MKYRYFLLLSALVFHFTSFSQSTARSISGKYNFLSITNNQGDTLFAISPKDTLVLNENETFSYFLTAKNKLAAHGKWHLENDLLTLNYTSPTDTVRYYTVIESGQILRFTESGITYAFQRDGHK